MRPRLLLTMGITLLVWSLTGIYAAFALPDAPAPASRPEPRALIYGNAFVDQKCSPLATESLLCAAPAVEADEYADPDEPRGQI